MFKTLAASLLAIAAQAHWPYWAYRTEWKYAYCVVEENPTIPEDERAGPQSNWMTVLHSGEVTVAVYESTPVLIEIKEPFPYDEYVHVLEGEVTLTDLDGNENTFKAGENFLVPKGFLGTWNMTTHYREMVVVETNAMMKAEGL